MIFFLLRDVFLQFQYFANLVLAPISGKNDPDQKKLLLFLSRHRFLIPEEFKLYAGIKKEAAFFGQGHFFQIWDPKQGLKNTEISRKRLLKEKKSLRMILTQQN